ncbi:MAG: hypothetical protein HDS11_02910 [Bacteroides sp.]|nr:hypothetical protein [Bacteroides sp.]
MSKITEFKERDIREHPEVKRYYDQAELNLQTEVFIYEVCEIIGLTVKDFAKFAEIRPSLIEHIKDSTIDVSYELLEHMARNLKINLGPKKFSCLKNSKLLQKEKQTTNEVFKRFLDTYI